jgi:hypothetical protein
VRVTYLLPAGIVVALMGLLLLFLEIGRLVGLRHIRRIGTEEAPGFGTIDGGIFALLGLLLAFTFSAASSRFDLRRQLLVDEANAIDTAYLRIDLLPADAQPRMRDAFRRYAESRVAFQLNYFSVEREEALQVMEALQRDIWSQAMAAFREPGSPQGTTILVTQSMNEMFDIASARAAAQRTHLPGAVMFLLLSLALTCALLAGYGLASARRRSWPHLLSFAIILAVTIYIIVDYEFPRVGIIRVDQFDQLLLDVRKAMR